MRIGKLRERVTIQTPITEKDRTGDERVTGWGSDVQRWAEIRHTGGGVSGSETLGGEQIVAVQSYVVRIRYSPFVSPKHSILIRGRRFQIRSAAHVGAAGRTTEIIAEESDPPEIQTP